MRSKKQRKNEALSNVMLFSGCDGKEISKIASLATEIAVPEGKVLAREGEAGREFYVILDGKADVEIGGNQVATLGPGDFFGEMALLDQGPRVATVKAVTPMEVAVLDPREFVSLIEEHPAVARKVLKVMAGRLRGAEQSPVH
ncbi:MAG: cyclic nucleotide-binding domain-containing protein [Actinomycetota bacterium]